MPPISADGLAASIFGRRKAPLARPYANRASAIAVRPKSETWPMPAKNMRLVFPLRERRSDGLRVP